MRIDQFHRQLKKLHMLGGDAHCGFCPRDILVRFALIDNRRFPLNDRGIGLFIRPLWLLCMIFGTGFPANFDDFCIIQIKVLADDAIIINLEHQGFFPDGAIAGSAVNLYFV